MDKYIYNPWPLGKLKPEHQRTEPDLLKQRGYPWSDPRDIVDMCEEKIAKFFGATYCVTTDCCSHALFLSLQYCLSHGEIKKAASITIPKHTYVSVPMQIIHAGLKVKFKNCEWKGWYALMPTRIIDAAVMWEKDSYKFNSLMCLSFQIKKAIPVGKMGAILTDDPDAAKWLKLASYDGRDLTTPYDSPGHVNILGWHMYATPEDCARAIMLMDDLPDSRGSYMGNKNYPDVEQMIKGL
jgi:dTDP-4-amino-4,6-dideoxygalactose transaminase